MADPFEVGLTELFTYQYIDGFMEITPMPLVIKANDTTLTYGDKLGDFGFTYSFDDSLVDPLEKQQFVDSISVWKYPYHTNL